jgi:nucleotide-binding universal stress UspA family protein
VKTILVATDGSRAGTSAVQLAIDLAVAHAALLNIAHVVPPFDMVPVDDEEVASYPHDPTDDEHGVLRAAAQLARGAGVRATTDLLPGPPVAALISHADETAAGVIVVGSRGHGALASAILGSVSLGLLRNARRPVLIVRGELA